MKINSRKPKTTGSKEWWKNTHGKKTEARRRRRKQSDRKKKTKKKGRKVEGKKRGSWNAVKAAKRKTHVGV